MKYLLSKHRIIRALLIGFGIFIWGIKIPNQFCDTEVLFCYTRDARGNKELVKENGAVFVEDVFIMEIPKEEWSNNENATITIILEDTKGNQKTKTIRLYERGAEE